VKKNRFDKFIIWTEKNANEGKSFRWWVYGLKVLKLNELNNAKQMISVYLINYQDIRIHVYVICTTEKYVKL